MSKNRKKKSAKISTVAVVITAMVALGVIVLIVALLSGWVNQAPSQPATKPIKIESPEDVGIHLGYGLQITEVAKYTGLYVEDGSNDIVSGVLMIVVENTGNTDVQLAEIEMPVGKKTACFKLTTLPAGESMVLLESNRMDYADAEFTTAIAKNVVLFDAPLSLCEDKIKIQILNGAINITNVSGGDITGEMVIYYKNSSSDMLYGGITYRVTVTGGLKAGEVKQLAGSHFSTSGTRIMFVTIG
jgi:hypothetical protein